MFKEFHHKLNFLTQSKHKTIIEDVNLILEKVLQEEHPENMPHGFLKPLILDAQYYVFRHYRWRQDPLFIEILQDYLQHQFQISSKQSSTISEALMNALDFKISPKDKSQFLRYIVVSVLTSHSSSATFTDLSISAEFFQYIIRTIRDISLARPYPSKVTETYAGIRDEAEAIIRDLLNRQQKETYVLEIEALWFKLNRTYSYKHVEKVFGSLIKIGLAEKGIKLDEIIDYLSSGSGLHTQPADVIKELEAAGLIYLVPIGKRSQSIYLTKEGLEITSSAFASGLLRNKEAAVDKIHQFPSAYQVPFLNRLGHSRPEECLNIIKNQGHQIYPKALKEATLKVSKKLSSHGAIYDTLEPLLQRSKSIKVKTAIIESLAYLNKEKRTSMLLEQIYQSATNDQIREAAINASGNLNSLQLNTEQTFPPRQQHK